MVCLGIGRFGASVDEIDLRFHARGALREDHRVRGSKIGRKRLLISRKAAPDGGIRLFSRSQQLE